MLFKMIVVLLFAVTVAFGAAQESRAQDGQVMTGEVINVDLHSGMITIRHGSNAPLGLGQSTDQFRVAEPIMLNALRPGAKVKFAAMRNGSELSITKILIE